MRAPESGSSFLSSSVVGVLCGAAAALFWAVGLVAARHGIAAGFSPSDLALHRFFWVGLVFLPMILRGGLRHPAGIGWGRGAVLMLFTGPVAAMLSYAGFLLVPLGHGGVIQPSTAALTGLLLATLVLKEPLPLSRALGAAAIVGGLVTIGAEAVMTIGSQGVLGDLSFAAAGIVFAVFGMLLRLWQLDPRRATMIVSVLSLAYLPVHAMLLGFGTLIAAGWWENALQAVMQGVLAGPLSIFLFAQAVVRLGAGRAAVFPALVPPFTLLIGFVALGEAPTLPQLAGLALVALGFRLTQKS